MRKFVSSFVVFLSIVVLSGCASTGKNLGNSELKTKVDSLESRVQRLEKGQMGLENMVADRITTSAQVTKARKIAIENPSNKDIQTALKNAGLYKGEIDGKIGAKTRDAIMEFQKKNDLKVDGVVGKNTWELLSEFY
ncbi:MAG: peptidoglycan-binding domain-containing protein [Candidatus Omnitrophota bacterium]